MFLKRNAKAGTVVGFYNGVRLLGMESKVSEAVRRSPYRMDNDWSRHEEILDIPSNYRSVGILHTILRQSDKRDFVGIQILSIHLLRLRYYKQKRCFLTLEFFEAKPVPLIKLSLHWRKR